MRSILHTSVFLLVAAQSATLAAAYKVGDTVVFIESAKVHHHNKENQSAGIGSIVEIDKVAESWLRIRGASAGWIKPDVVRTPQDAAAHFTKLLDDQPDALAMRLARGTVRQHLGEHDLAIEDFTAVIERKPDWDSAYYNRGNSYYALKQYEVAVHDFDESLKRRPNDAWVYNNRGLCWYALRNFQKAADDFTTALEIDPEQALISRNRRLAFQQIKLAASPRMRTGGGAHGETRSGSAALEVERGAAHPAALRGRWKVTGTTLNGRKFDHLLGGRATFTDDRLKLKVKKFGELEFRYKIDPTKNQLSVSRGAGLAPLPPELDVLARQIAGSARTTTYSLKGDRLQANINLAGLPVPQEIKDRLGAAATGGKLVIEMHRDNSDRRANVRR